MTNTETEEVQVIPEDEILDKRIAFPRGLPGFPESHDFILSQSEGEKPFAWLRYLGDSDLAFAVIEAYHLVPDYTFEVNDEDLESIGSPSPKDCAVLLILRIEMEERGLKIHANLKAPLIINTVDKQGGQFMLTGKEAYSEDTVFAF